MNIEAIYHTPHGAYAYTNGPDTMRVRLRTSNRETLTCEVYWNDRCGSPECLDRSTPMTWLANDGTFTYWEAELYEPHRRLRYAFHIVSHDKHEQIWYTEDGFSTTPTTERWLSGLFNWPYLYETQRIDVPAWVRDAVFYEIFPERFANGNPHNNHPATQHWTGKPAWFSFWGGDLAGIEQHLAYLQELGINALWLTPIFQAPSNHKYDTADYTKIDPYFGTEEDFQHLLAACHAHNIRVVLDAVFNHSGTDFFAWRDVVEHGEASPYVDWFHIHGFPLDRQKPGYRTFDHHGNMPKLNTAHPALQRYLIDAAAKWTRMGVDGWRLDVASEVDLSLWRAFRRELRAINPQLYIVGEIEHEAARWTLGDLFDGVQHYPVYRAIHHFFTRTEEAPWEGLAHSQSWDAATFDRRLGRIRSWYPTPVFPALLTPLSTHDTPRFLTLCQDRRKQQLAATFLLTYTGLPMIYYGEEIGMEGGPDPDCRRSMIWDAQQQDQEMLAFYQHLIALRHHHAALRADGVWTCMAQEQSYVYSYVRGTLPIPLAQSPDASQCALIVLNNSENAQTVTLPLQIASYGAEPIWVDGTLLRDELHMQLYRVEHAQVTLQLGAYQGAILVPYITV